MSPTQYAHTVRCIDEVVCYCVWYDTVRYGTVPVPVRYGTVLYGTLPYGTVWYIYRTVRYRTKNLEIMERGEADPI